MTQITINCTTGIVTQEASPQKDLAAIKAAAWEAVKSIRAQKEYAGCETAFGHRIQTDESSRLKINGLVSMAMLAKSSNTEMDAVFTFEDNFNVELDADELIFLGVTVGTFIKDIYEYSFDLRNEIEDAETENQVLSIDITNGWPT